MLHKTPYLHLNCTCKGINKSELSGLVGYVLIKLLPPILVFIIVLLRNKSGKCRNDMISFKIMQDEIGIDIVEVESYSHVANTPISKYSFEDFLHLLFDMQVRMAGLGRGNY